MNELIISIAALLFLAGLAVSLWSILGTCKEQKEKDL
jgi:hypothetical protein